MKFNILLIVCIVFSSTLTHAQTASEFYNNAMTFKQKDNLTETARLLKKALELEPNNTTYKTEMADVQYQRKAFFESIPLYEEMLANDEKNLEILSRLAEMYSMSPQKMKGVQYAEQALKLKPQSGEINKMLARTFMEVGHYPKAVKLYLEAEKSMPQDKDLPFKIAACYEKMGKNRESMAYHLKALTLDPKNSTKMYEAALSCYEASNYDESIKLFQLAEDNGYFRTKTFYSNWALNYLELKDINKAIFYYTKAKDFAPYDKDINLSMAEAYMRGGEFKKSREVLDEMLELNPEDAEVLYTKGMTYYKDGNTSKAEGFFNKAFEIDPSLKSLRYSKSNF